MEGRIVPKGNNILVEMQEERGTFMLASDPQYPKEGIVVEVTEDKVEYPPRFKAGDRVLFPGNKGFKFPDALGKRIMSQSDILSKIIK